MTLLDHLRTLPAAPEADDDESEHYDPDAPRLAVFVYDASSAEVAALYSPAYRHHPYAIVRGLNRSALERLEAPSPTLTQGVVAVTLEALRDTSLPLPVARERAFRRLEATAAQVLTAREGVTEISEGYPLQDFALFGESPPLGLPSEAKYVKDISFSFQLWR